MITSWKKIFEEKYSFGFRNIVVKTFEDQNGKVEVWPTFSNKDFGTVLAITEDNKIIVLKQFRVGPEEIVCQLPGGEMEAEDKNVEETMAKELLQETGYAGDIEYVGKFLMSAYDNYHGHLGIAKGVKKVAEATLDHNEFIEQHLMDVSEVKQLLKERKFIDS